MKSAADIISNPASGNKSSSPSKARSRQRRSCSAEGQRPRDPQQPRPHSTAPRLCYTPEPDTPASLPPPPPKSQPAPPLVEKSTEIIDLTESTPEPTRTSLSEELAKAAFLLDLTSEEVPGPPKSFANSTRSWKPLSEVERPIASGSTSGSSISGVSFTFSCNTSSTSATSNTSLPSKPPSPLIADFNVQVPAGIRTPKRSGYTTGSPRRRPFERQHIHAQQHKLNIAKQRRVLREQAFMKQRKRGYTGSKIDFEDIFRYASEVRQVIPETAAVPEFIWEAGYWEEIRKQTNDAPLVKPYTPSLDEVDRKIRDKNRFLDELRQPKLPEALPAEEDEKVSKLLNTRGTIAKCAREQVTDQDIYRLRPGQWLNDEVINFYGAMINARSDDKHAKVKRGQVMNSFYLSTFFWEKLSKEGYEKGRLAKWTKKVDIFAKDVVLIPVNHSNRHWTAAAINFKRKRIESYDSMNMAGADVCRRLRQYVEQEHLNKKKKPFDWTGWEDFIDRDHPQQENGFDCGVFTCQTLESLARGEETRIFTQANMPYIRRKMIWEIGHTRLRDDV